MPVFHRNGERIRSFRGSWAEACSAAGLAGLRFHDLKRSAARNMIRAGVSENVIMKMAGWRTLSMLWRYDIVNETDMAAGFKATAAYVAAREKQPRKVAALAKRQAAL